MDPNQLMPIDAAVLTAGFYAGVIVSCWLFRDRRTEGIRANDPTDCPM